METIINQSQEKLTDFNDERAFELLYREYFVRLFRFCLSIIHRKEPAEEIVHDVFVNCWKKREELSSIKNLELYLYVSVKNLALNHIRDDHFAHTLDISERMNDFIQFRADPESLMVSSETVSRLLAVIDSLPPRCRLIFKLVKEDGLKYKDVATLLDLSVKTVEAQLAIAIRRIAAAASI